MSGIVRWAGRLENMTRMKKVRGKVDKTKMYSEKVVWNWLKRCCQEQDAFLTKMHPITNAGIGDGLIHWRGRTFYVECKTTGEKCTPIQCEMHKRLKEYGIETYVLDTKITNLFDLYVVSYKTYDENYNKLKD